MSLLLKVDELSRSFGPQPLFRNISFSLSDEERTALIGPNGSGKSTLLRILAGLDTPDSGSVEVRRQMNFGYVPQADVFAAGATVEGVVLEAVAGEHLEEHECHSRVAVQLGRCGFTRFDQPVEELSGGWRKRLALARALIRQPDLLLLDEPTNHLDIEAIQWLEKLLRAAPFAFLLVSHDRYFLENVTNRVIELNAMYADGYLSANGAYSDYLVRQEEYLASQARTQQSLAGRVRREIEWLKRGAKARTTKAKGRIEQAQRMQEELGEVTARNSAAGSIKIDFNSSRRQTRKLLTMSHVAKTLGGRELFKDLALTLSPGVKLGLLGANGSGKTTLIRLIGGEMTPDAGAIFRAEGLRIVRFDQDRQQLDKTQTLRYALSGGSETVVYRGLPMHVTAWARQFLFRNEQLDSLVAELSGGEQARILIARLMLQPADLLILDEPTNDLDIPSLEVLEESLVEFPGAVVLVTHDRYMLDRISTDLLAIDGEGGANLYASLAQWEAAQAGAAREQKESRDAAARPNGKSPESPKRPAPGIRRLSYMEQREWEQMEQKILQAEQAVEACHHALDDPAMAADRLRLEKGCSALSEAQEAVTRLYARWEELEKKMNQEL